MKYTTTPPSITNLASYRLPPPISHPKNCLSATTKSYKYLNRLFKFNQMDFEYALWQMIYLFISPQKLYRNFNYRKQTRSQFARDDPAFLVLLIVCLCGTSLGFAYVLGLNVTQSILLILSVVFVDCIVVGLIIATLFWCATNGYFRKNTGDPDVEWGYSFDVHLNALFPPLMILHCVQVFFYNWLISKPWFVSRILGNTFWLFALGYYVYITFLGYNCLPHLKNTRLILIPLPIIFLLYIITIIIGWNVTISFMNFYKYRVWLI